MIISRKRFEEEIMRRLDEERNRVHIENDMARCFREMYSEIGRLETMIRSVEARVEVLIAKKDGTKNED